ncbi:MAG: ABC transporter permease [Gammaproteobacteria bacterium]|nr:ABC transporter permease [Gammaproteobacteria bacterium]
MSMLIGLYTVVRREIIRILRIWPQTLLPPAITTALYFIIFGQLIGKQIAPINNYSYIQYITPGLIMMAVISNAYGNVVTSFFGAKFQRHIEELLISPMSNFYILTGYLLGGVIRGLLVGLIVTLISLFFSKIAIAHYLLTIYVLLMTALLFSITGFINGIYAKNFDDTSIIPVFFLTPLTYLGGVFFSISMLPSFGQNLAMINPIFYNINAFRYSLLGIEESNIFYSVSMLSLITLGLYYYAWHLLNKGVGIRN